MLKIRYKRIKFTFRKFFFIFKKFAIRFFKTNKSLHEEKENKKEA